MACFRSPSLDNLAQTIPSAQLPGELMSPSDSSRVRSVIATERALLGRICRSGGIQAVSTNAWQQLYRYPWMGPDHQIIFQALLRLAHAPASSLREQLPAEATRMGFPDILWDSYFEAQGDESGSQDTVAELIDKLISESARAR